MHSYAKWKRNNLYIYTFDKRLNQDPIEIDVEDENGQKKLIKYVFRKN